MTDDSSFDDLGNRTALTVRGLSKRFAGATALSNIDLDIKRGEVHALVGHNGSGKSTLIKVLAGYHRPEAGSRATVGGTRLTFAQPAASFDVGLRFVHQDLALVDTLDAVTNLGLGRGYVTGLAGRILWHQETASAERRMREFGYAIDVRCPVGELRPTERVGVALARALDGWESANVLIVDEPTAALPRADINILFAAIRRVRERGIAVVYVSHRLHEVFEIADRVTVLRDAQRIGTYSVSDLSEPALVNLMVGSAVDTTGGSPARPSAAVDPVLQVRGLTSDTLRSVDVSVRPGEILGIAGLTGSGREDLLGAIFARPRHSGGTVSIDGKIVPDDDPHASVNAGLAFVPADRRHLSSVESLSIQHNMTLTDLKRHSGRLGALRKRAEWEEAYQWIADLEIRPPDPDAPFVELSGGNQQKVIIAKWLRLHPKVLLLDEPTQGVDVYSKARIHHLARAAARKGTSILIASSDDKELCGVCDRVLIIRGGEVVAELAGQMIDESELARFQLAG